MDSLYFHFDNKAFFNKYKDRLEENYGNSYDQILFNKPNEIIYVKNKPYTRFVYIYYLQDNYKAIQEDVLITFATSNDDHFLINETIEGERIRYQPNDTISYQINP